MAIMCLWEMKNYERWFVLVQVSEKKTSNLGLEMTVSDFLDVFVPVCAEKDEYICSCFFLFRPISQIKLGIVKKFGIVFSELRSEWAYQ